MSIETISSLFFFILLFASCFFFAKLLVRKNQIKVLKERLNLIVEKNNYIEAESLANNFLQTQANKRSNLDISYLNKHLAKLINLAGLNLNLTDFCFLTLALFIVPIILGILFELNLLLCLLISFVCPVAIYSFLKFRGNKRRELFLLQMPNAIDLMVSILKSGHSIPQSVKAIGEELPNPCGIEFIEIYQRMNLGQSLPEALKNTVERYDSFELDLIRRACQIQQEVGGSLAELLDKTNATLRQRIKLKKQVSVMTAQGKLSAIICGILPIVIALAFSLINPNYLEPLFNTSLGKLLLILALFLELIGFVVMRKLSSFRL